MMIILHFFSKMKVLSFFLFLDLKCKANLNFVFDFGVNGAIGTIVTKWDFFFVLKMDCFHP